MDIVFLSRIIPEDMPQVAMKRKKTMTESGEALMWKIIRGLDYNLNKPVTLYNFLPVQSYPKYYPEMFISKSYFSHTKEANDINLPFINVQYVKRIFMGISLYSQIRKWAMMNTYEKKIIISYSMTPEFIEAMKIAKLLNPNIVTCCIVADLPEYTILTNNMNLTTRLYLKWIKYKTKKSLDFIDKFVLLTKFMAEKLVTRQEYITLEGVSTVFPFEKRKEKYSEKYLFYAGTLNERFGIINLLKAFSLIDNVNYRLVICGFGDSINTILEYAKKDQRVLFRGQLKRIEVLKLMSKCNVIVNPRLGLEEFTRYSFPSKNLEALSSGVPLIAYKLQGISDEYDYFINYPKDNSVEVLAQIIKEVCEDSSGYYARKASEAKRWVETTKNEKVQCKRILELVSRENIKI